MIELSLDDVARLCPGRLETAPGATHVSGLEIDSRRIGPGDLFVAIRSGADFVDDALTRGASAAIVPDDPHAAMASLAGAVRARLGAQVVGVTGSTGKTSTKDILAALCRPHARTVAAEQSHNNEIGLPLTITRASEDTEILIAELGARDVGQIAELARIARPHIAVITQIGPAHLEIFWTVERVAQTEAEIVAELPPGGTVIAPADEPLLDPYLGRLDVNVVTYGPGGDVRLLEDSWNDGAHLSISLGGVDLELDLNVRGRHQATNALAALAAYRALGLPLEQVHRGATEVELSRWRSEEHVLLGGGLLVNDSYNANPLSMLAAIEHLAERAGGRRRVAVLGDMAELGPGALGYHREIGEAASRSGIDAVVAVGELARAYLEAGGFEGSWVPDAKSAIAVVHEAVRPGDCVLVKGSRSVGLEVVAESLVSVTA